MSKDREELIKNIVKGDYTILLAFSGGKDSIALVLSLLDLGVKPNLIHLHHHDVDGYGETLFDWKCTRAYCYAFAKAIGCPIFFSYREGGILREINRNNEGLQDVLYQREVDGEFIRILSNKSERYWNTRGKFPAVSANLTTRWCSSVVKIEVLKRIIANSPDYKHLSKIVVLTGERREESPNRAKYQEVEYHPTRTQAREVIQFRLIIDLTEEQVWSMIQRYSIQPHPAYMLGWNRCSCMLCIFSSPDVWASIANIDDARISRIEGIEENLGFTLYDKSTIWDKVYKGTSFVDFTDSKQEFWMDKAVSETWELPIKVNNWKLPKGAFKNMHAGAF